MRNLFLFLTVLIVSLQLSAQDTLSMYSTEYYMFNPKPKLERMNNEPSGHGCVDAGYIVQNYFSSKPITVYGVAITFKNSPNKPPYAMFDDDNNTYKAVVLQRNGPDWSDIGTTYRPFSEVASAHIYGHLVKYCTFRYDLDQPMPRSYYTPCYEIYFHSPIQVSDTFYVGRHYMGGSNLFYPLEYYGVYNRSSFDSNYFYYATSPYYGTPHNSYSSSRCWGWAFPIIKLRCTGIDEKNFPVELQAVGSQGAIVTWRFIEEGTVFDVRLFNSGGDFDTIITTTDTTITFSNLPLGGQYNVQVRKQCRYQTHDYDTIIYSQWTSAVTFGSDPNHGGGGGGDTVNINMVENVDFGLSPNPAHSQVEVRWLQPQEEAGTLTIYDMSGRKVQQINIPTGSQALVLNVENYQTGAYILKTVTPYGVLSRKLIIK